MENDWSFCKIKLEFNEIIVNKILETIYGKFKKSLLMSVGETSTGFG